MQAIDSPCTKICTLHPQVQVCVGCGRNLVEIEAWPKLSNEERTSLIEIIRRRLVSLREGNWQTLA